jgi:hypothetical protein
VWGAGEGWGLQGITPLFWNYAEWDPASEAAGKPLRRNLFLLPFIFMSRDPERTIHGIAPLYVWGDGKDWSLRGITPLFWDYEERDAGQGGAEEVRKRSLLLLPLLIHVRDEDRTVQFYGLDLLVRSVGPDEGSLSVLWPFFHHRWERDSTRIWVFPFFWRFRDGDPEAGGGRTLVVLNYLRHQGQQDILHLWPFFGRREDGAYREFSTIWPFFIYGSDGADRRFLNLAAPLFFHAKKGADDWGWSVLFPLIAQTRSGTEDHSRFFPLFLHWKDAAADTRHLHILWPLVRSAREKDESNFRLLLPYITWREKGDESDFRVFWKWIYHTRTKDSSTLRVNPFFRTDTNAKGDSYWSVLGGLISHKVEDGQGSGKFLWVIPY